MPSPPSGFILPSKPRSSAEAASQFSNDRLKTLCKSAVHTYIASFLDTTGPNRGLIQATSPSGVNFVTDRSLQDSKDPAIRPTQLARMYNEIRFKIPSILIIDSSLEWVPTGLGGGLEQASNRNGKWQGFYRTMARVGLTIAVVTNDQDSTDTLQNILLLIFDPFRNVAGGSQLHSTDPADSWEVRLPLRFDVGANTPNAFEGDPKEQYWSTTIDMLVDVEDQVGFEMPMDRFDIGVGIVGDLGLTHSPSITAPSSVRVGAGTFRPTISRFDPRVHRLMIDNPSVATFEVEGTRVTVTPHRPGTFKLELFDNSKPLGSDAGPLAPFVYKVVASATVDVTF